MNEPTQPLKWNVFWVIFILGFMVNLPFLSQYGPGVHDEAVISVGAERILDGEIPYRDWDSRFPPGSYLLTALSFLILGVNLWSLRLVMLLTGATVGVLVYLIARYLVPEKWAQLTSALVLIGVVSQISILSYHLLAIIFFLAGILGLCEWSIKPSRSALVGTGTALAGACLFLQTEAAALLGTCLLVFFLFRKRLTRHDILVFSLSWLGLSLVLWSWVLILSSPLDVWRDNVLSAFGLTRNFNFSPYDLTHLTTRWTVFLTQWKTAPLNLPVFLWSIQTLSHLSVWSLEYASFFPLLFLFLVVALKRRQNLEPPVLICLIGLCLFTFISKHRLDLLYLKYLTPLWYSLSVWLIYNFSPKKKLVGAGLTILFALSYAFSVKDSLDYIYPIHTPRGTLYSNSKEEAERMNLGLAILSDSMKPRQPTLLYPYACAYYFWGNFRNVIRPPVLVPLLYSPEQFRDAKKTIDTESPPIIAHFPLSENVFADYPKLDRALFMKQYKIRFEKLFEHYKVIKKGPSFVLYQISSKVESQPTKLPKKEL